MSPEDVEFAHAISENKKLSEVELVKRVCWFISARDQVRSVALAEAVNFLSEHSVRPNINVSRLRKNLKKDRSISISQSSLLQLPRAQATEIGKEYQGVLNAKPEVIDNLLVSSDFVGSRPYILSIVDQINGSYQFHHYDACAVMMRRLVEVLIIDAFHTAGQDALIRDSNANLVMMNGLINALKSGRPFKLSRNAPKQLESVKVLGDTAAHSRNYITKKKDIDDFAQSFRVLVDECRSLS